MAWYDNLRNWGDETINRYTYGIGNLGGQLNPTRRTTRNALQRILTRDFSDDDVRTEALLRQLAEQSDVSNNPYWESLTDRQKSSLLENYYNDVSDQNTLYGLLGKAQEFDTEAFLNDLNELRNVDTALPTRDAYGLDLAQIRNDAQASIDNDNANLLKSLNEDLASQSKSFRNYRDTLLANDAMNRARTNDTMASEMSRARRTAIESGASAGIRIAGNVNAVLSAQNRQSQESLNTANNLAQMLVSQRNAESGLRGQWRDAQASTYDRVQNRTNSEYNYRQNRYDEAMRNWNEKATSGVSKTNALADGYLAQIQSGKKYTSQPNGG